MRRDVRFVSGRGASEARERVAYCVESRDHATLGSSERAQAESGQAPLQLAQVVLAKGEVVRKIAACLSVGRVEPGEFTREFGFDFRGIRLELRHGFPELHQVDICGHDDRQARTAPGTPAASQIMAAPKPRGWHAVNREAKFVAFVRLASSARPRARRSLA